MEHFKFNDYGVCTDPIVAIKLEKGRGRVSVRVAQSPSGRWAAGIDASFPTHGFGSPVSLCGPADGFATEAEAICRGIDEVLAYLERHDGKEERALCDLVKMERPGQKVEQLTLF